jgi:hypothetical protein
MTKLRSYTFDDLSVQFGYTLDYVAVNDFWLAVLFINDLEENCLFRLALPDTCVMVEADYKVGDGCVIKAARPTDVPAILRARVRSAAVEVIKKWWQAQDVTL